MNFSFPLILHHHQVDAQRTVVAACQSCGKQVRPPFAHLVHILDAMSPCRRNALPKLLLRSHDIAAIPALLRRFEHRMAKKRDLAFTREMKFEGKIKHFLVVAIDEQAVVPLHQDTDFLCESRICQPSDQIAATAAGEGLFDDDHFVGGKRYVIQPFDKAHLVADPPIVRLSALVLKVVHQANSESTV